MPTCETHLSCPPFTFRDGDISHVLTLLRLGTLAHMLRTTRMRLGTRFDLQ